MSTIQEDQLPIPRSLFRIGLALSGLSPWILLLTKQFTLLSDEFGLVLLASNASTFVLSAIFLKRERTIRGGRGWILWITGYFTLGSWLVLASSFALRDTHFPLRGMGSFVSLICCAVMQIVVQSSRAKPRLPSELKDKSNTIAL